MQTTVQICTVTPGGKLCRWVGKERILEDRKGGFPFSNYRAVAGLTDFVTV